MSSGDRLGIAFGIFEFTTWWDQSACDDMQDAVRARIEACKDARRPTLKGKLLRALMGMEVTCLRHSSSNLEKVLVRQTRAVARMPIRYLRRPRVLNDHRDD